DVTPALYNSDVLLIIVIPGDFDSQLAKGTAAIELITDGRNPMIAGMTARYVTAIASTWSLQRTGGKLPVTVESRTWFNPNQLSRWTFLPSFLAMIAFVQVMFLAGLSIARERERGTFDQLLVTPLSPTEILICKATPPVLVGLMQSMMLFLIVRFWFGVPFAGSFVTLFTSILIFLVSTTGLGLSISSISRNMQQVLVYLLVLMIPMVLLSGLVTPVDNMPQALQLVTWADPMRFIVDAVRRIYLEGAGFAEIGLDFIPMLAVAAVTMPAAGWLFRHKAA
ncbi:ABC transporter permease, partial [Mitsuokella sp.]|uniref:ABC transporter permease n=1 Tax=Mitsuokella sp. TaxID=2049034 RepID=UPI002A80A89A